MMMRSIRKNGWLGLMLIALTGCSLAYPETNSYVLTGTHSLIYSSKRTTKSVLSVIMLPGDLAFDTTRMVYVNKPYQINYFSKNQWVNTPTQMLAPLIVQSLQKTQHFHAVVSAPYQGNCDLVLTIALLQLQQNFLYRPSQVEMKVRARLINAKTQQIIATRLFNLNEITPTDTPYGGVIAANQAIDKLLQQLDAFVIQASR